MRRPMGMDVVENVLKADEKTFRREYFKRKRKREGQKRQKCGHRGRKVAKAWSRLLKTSSYKPVDSAELGGSIMSR